MMEVQTSDRPAGMRARVAIAMRFILVFDLMPLTPSRDLEQLHALLDGVASSSNCIDPPIQQRAPCSLS